MMPVLDDTAELTAAVAVIVIICVAATVDGEVYRPVVSICPTLGLIDHVTALLLEPVTVALNCSAFGVVRLGKGGVITTLMDAAGGEGGGCRLTVAVADFVPSATLVAVIVTVCAAAMLAGAL